VIVQCDSGHKHIDLIACASYCILHEKTQASVSHPQNITHVVFIVGLPRKKGGTKFNSFQGGKWESYHMDNLRSTNDLLFTIEKALDTSIDELLQKCYENQPKAMHDRLLDCIKLQHILKSNHVTVDEAMERFNLLLQLVENNPKCQAPLNNSAEKNRKFHYNNYIIIIIISSGIIVFCESLVKHIFAKLRARKDIRSNEEKQAWAINEAMNANALHDNGSFITVLSLKVEHIIAIALNNVIDYIDNFGNLSLLFSGSEAIKMIWLKIFDDQDIVDVTSEKDPGEIKVSFKCQFPFFWFVVKKINSRWNIAETKGKTL